MAAHQLEAWTNDRRVRRREILRQGSPKKRLPLAGDRLRRDQAKTCRPTWNRAFEATSPTTQKISVSRLGPTSASWKLTRNRRDRIPASYVAVDDCGNLTNPVARATDRSTAASCRSIAQALFEEAVHDDKDGNLKTTRLMDYTVP